MHAEHGAGGDREFCAAVDEMSKGIGSVREVVQGLLKTCVAHCSS